jgi:hypothetical protein
MPSQVWPQQTVVSPIEMFGSLVRVWTGRFGPPSRSQILMLLAQWALETGNGQSEYNYNPGGIKHVSGDGYDWTTYGTTEVVNGSTQSQQAAFAAYPDLDSGTDAYLSLLQHHYPQAWQVVVDGSSDTAAFATGLKAGGYFTAPVQNETDANGNLVPGYAPGLAARLAQMDAEVPPNESLVPVLRFNPKSLIVVAGAGFLLYTYLSGDLERFWRREARPVVRKIPLIGAFA